LKTEGVSVVGIEEKTRTALDPPDAPQHPALIALVGGDVLLTLALTAIKSSWPHVIVDIAVKTNI